MDHRSEFGVEMVCRVLKASRSGFYRWLKDTEGHRGRHRRLLFEQIAEVFRQNRGAYGAPRVYRALKARGVACSKDLVAQLMAENGLQAKAGRRYKATTNSKHSMPVANNVLNRRFEVGEPNRVWVADITSIATDEGWLYLAAVMDLGTRKIVGWAMAETMTKELVITALAQANGRRGCPEGVIHHSDRGSQYASRAYQDLLLERGWCAA